MAEHCGYTCRWRQLSEARLFQRLVKKWHRFLYLPLPMGQSFLKNHLRVPALKEFQDSGCLQSHGLFVSLSPTHHCEFVNSLIHVVGSSIGQHRQA